MNISQALIKQKPILFMASAVFTIVIGSSTVHADDTEAYLVEEIDPIGPNILFILDESGSMRWDSTRYNTVADTDPSQRMYQMKQALRTLIQDESMDNVNAAMLGYSGNRNNTIVQSDFIRVGDGSNRSNLLNNVIGDAHIGGSLTGTLIHSGGTPSTPALKEGMAWYRGNKSGVDSPVANWCEPNYMIFLTDGEPNRNEGDTVYEGATCSANETNFNWSGTDGSDAGARCSATIAKWGYEHRPLTDGAWNYGDNDPELKQFRNVITHTIGFHTTAGTVKEGYLQEIAAKSLDEDPAHASANFFNGYDTGNSDDPYTGGRYSRAGNESELLAALQDFVDQANRGITFTYTAPAIPFNPDNAAISGDRIYVPMFNPDAKTLWKGNLKKYKVGVKADGTFLLNDTFDNPVVTSDLLFRQTQDLWGSSLTDDSLIGGAASHQTGTRNLLTRIGTASTNLVLVHKDTEDSGDPVITVDMLGDQVNTEIERQSILDWISGVSGEHTGFMGAPLHSSPAIVRYSGGNDLVLLSTTEGILHAFDGETGEEVWAFMPDEILPELSKMRQNDDTQLSPVYGLDGPLTVYDYNGRKYAIVGMRRGGRNYYTLDITSRSNPTFAWEVIGGTGAFAKLAQTWSKPIFTKLDLGSGPQEYVLFGGGYNATLQDEATTRQPDTIGNALYIVNPGSGSYVWGSELSGIITNSIAGDVLPIDINANGITDRLYLADIGGRILRVDIPDALFTDRTIRWAVIADINENSDGSFRRFFNTPEIGYFSRGGVQYLAVLIGTGHRPKPLDNDSTDRFYMIKDFNVWLAPADGNYKKVDHATLVEAAQGNTITDGWYMDVKHNGETYKVFSKARLYDNAVLFSGYRGFTAGGAGVGSSDPCVANAAQGKSAFFAIDMVSGAGIFAGLGADPDDPTKGRSKNLKIPGIPPSPTLLFPSTESDALGGEVIAIVGLEELQRWSDRFHSISWEECGAEECGGN